MQRPPIRNFSVGGFFIHVYSSGYEKQNPTTNDESSGFESTIGQHHGGAVSRRLIVSILMWVLFILWMGFCMRVVDKLPITIRVVTELLRENRECDDEKMVARAYKIASLIAEKCKHDAFNLNSKSYISPNIQRKNVSREHVENVWTNGFRDGVESGLVR